MLWNWKFKLIKIMQLKNIKVVFVFYLILNRTLILNSIKY